MTFEYDLNHFVYDSIWLNMMYIIEKHCLKWFACKVSHGNIQNTMEIWRNTSKKNKKSKQSYPFRFLPHEMMRSKAQNLHARFFWCPGLEFGLKTPKQNKQLHDFDTFTFLILIFFDFWNKTEFAIRFEAKKRVRKLEASLTLKPSTVPIWRPAICVRSYGKSKTCKNTRRGYTKYVGCIFNHPKIIP